MNTFGRLCLGDMFNTMTARWVKTSPTEAICVMSAIHPLGTIKQFEEDDENIVLLWSAVLKS